MRICVKYASAILHTPGGVIGMGAKREIRIFKIFTFWFWFSNYILNPYMSPYAQQLGATNVIIGFLVSAYSVAQIILKLPLGIVSDRIGRKKIFIVIGAAITLVAELGMYFSANVGGLIAFRLLQGIAVSAWVCATVLFASYLPPEQAVNATIELQIMNFGGTLTGYFLGGIVSSSFGYRSVFLVAALGALCAFVFTLLIREDKCMKAEPVRTAQLVKVAKSPFLLLVTTVCMVGQMILATTTWGFTPTLAVSLGAKPMQVSLLSVCASVPGLICSLFISRRLIALWGEKKIVLLATFFEALFCFTQPLNPNLPMLAVNCCLSGLFHSMSYSVLLGLSIKHYPNRIRAAAMGFMQSFYCVGLFIGPVIAGWVNDLYGIQAGFKVIGLISFIAPVLVIVLYDRCEQATLREVKDGRI